MCAIIILPRDADSCGTDAKADFAGDNIGLRLCREHAVFPGRTSSANTNSDAGHQQSRVSGGPVLRGPLEPHARTISAECARLCVLSPDCTLTQFVSPDCVITYLCRRLRRVHPVLHSKIFRDSWPLGKPRGPETVVARLRRGHSSGPGHRLHCRSLLSDLPQSCGPHRHLVSHSHLPQSSHNPPALRLFFSRPHVAFAVRLASPSCFRQAFVPARLGGLAFPTPSPPHTTHHPTTPIHSTPPRTRGTV